jgi:hypothetical protein
MEMMRYKETNKEMMRYEETKKRTEENKKEKRRMYKSFCGLKYTYYLHVRVLHWEVNVHLLVRQWNVFTRLCVYHSR